MRAVIGLVAIIASAVSIEGRSQLPYRSPLGPLKSKRTSLLGAEDDRGLLQECKEHYRDVSLDHFSWVCYKLGMLLVLLMDSRLPQSLR